MSHQFPPTHMFAIIQWSSYFRGIYRMHNKVDEELILEVKNFVNWRIDISAGINHDDQNR